MGRNCRKVCKKASNQKKCRKDCKKTRRGRKLSDVEATSASTTNVGMQPLASTPYPVLRNTLSAVTPPPVVETPTNFAIDLDSLAGALSKFPAEMNSQEYADQAQSI